MGGLFSKLRGMELIRVAAAIIINNGGILCVRRGENKLDYLSYKFEFPGGKIEEGESEKEALSREIQEELLMEIEIADKLMVVEHTYPDFELEMHAYICACRKREFTLTEHTSFAWSLREDLGEFDWAEADIPIVKKLQNDG